MSTQLQTRREMASALPFTPAQTRLLQRKCACGGTPGLDGECEECRAKQLQRSTTNQSTPSAVPPIVHDALRSPGQPLDAGTRTFMEPRFGHDFSNVRVHTDARAAESAREVNALAYTVGRDVVFGAGQYVPQTSRGRKLLAHELTHVAQQAKDVAILRNNSHLREKSEYETGKQVISIKALESNPSLHRALYRNKRFTLSPPQKEGLQERLHLLDKRLHINYKHLPLSEEDKAMISATITNVPSAASVQAFKEGPRFVLHDTGMKLPKTAKDREDWIQKNKALAPHGPLGQGADAYLRLARDPQADEPVVVRSPFQPQRPTATKYERGEDILKPDQREKTLREVWRATKPDVQEDALRTVLEPHNLYKLADLSGLSEQLKNDEIKKLPDNTKEYLNRSKVARKAKDPGNKAKGKEEEKIGVLTTAMMVIEEICRRVQMKGIKSVASSSNSQALEMCEKDNKKKGKLAELYDARNRRIEASTNVEILLDLGSDCDTKHPRKLPATYSEDQYKILRDLYLRAAFQIGQYPEITTHFWVDRKLNGHCDPRCFNLTHLYELIGEALGHEKGSMYGIEPQYGFRSGIDNVWWHDKACPGSRPK